MNINKPSSPSSEYARNMLVMIPNLRLSRGLLSRMNRVLRAGKPFKSRAKGPSVMVMRDVKWWFQPKNVRVALAPSPTIPDLQYTGQSGTGKERFMAKLLPNGLTLEWKRANRTHYRKKQYPMKTYGFGKNEIQLTGRPLYWTVKTANWSLTDSNGQVVKSGRLKEMRRMLRSNDPRQLRELRSTFGMQPDLLKRLLASKL
jgi:hypothetical protein